MKKMVLASAALMLFGCSSYEKRDARLVKVVERQNTILELIKKDRARPEVKSKIDRSMVLVESETKLNDAINGITESNKRVLKAMGGHEDGKEESKKQKR